MTQTLDAEFIEGIRRDMLRFAQMQLRDHHAAEDAVQEAIVAALNAEKSFSGRSALKTWVFTILRNKIIDTIRSQARSVNASALSAECTEFEESFDRLFKENEHWQPQSAPTAWGDPENALRQEQFWAVFDACLTHLPENTARVFMMREFLEFDTDEICAELKINTSNCHVILHRARNGLRRCLETSWFAPGEQPC
jgi:RNA polymerase sigma-70 factor (TIGR02943 family)